MKQVKECNSLLKSISNFNKVEAKRSTLKLGQIINEIITGIDSTSLKKKKSQSGSVSKAALWKLKSRLTANIISSILSLDPVKKFSNAFDRSYFTTGRNLSIGRALLQLGFKKEALKYVHMAYKTAKRFQHTEFAVSSLNVLCYIESLIGNRNTFLVYVKELNTLTKMLCYEYKASNYYYELTFISRYNAEADSHAQTKAHKYFKELVKVPGKFASHRFRNSRFRTGIRCMEFTQDFTGIISLCNAHEKYCRIQPHLNTGTLLAEIALYKMDAFLSLQKYNLGKKCAEDCSRYFNRRTNNWIVYMEFYFLLCIRTQDIFEAQKVLIDVVKHSKFYDTSSEKKEKWKLFEAYLYFMLPGELRKRKFNVFRFVNEVPVLSRDKGGYSFAILVAEIILLVDAGNYDRLIELTSAFYSYVRRYIKPKANRRGYCFARMLLVMLRCNFDYEKIIMKSKPFLEKLTSKKEGNNYLEPMEIIPYEQLWKEILERLKKNRHLIAVG